MNRSRTDPEQTELIYRLRKYSNEAESRSIKVKFKSSSSFSGAYY